MNTPTDKARALRLHGIKRDLGHALALVRNRRADLHIHCQPLTALGVNLHTDAIRNLDKAGDAIHDALAALSVLS